MSVFEWSNPKNEKETNNANEHIFRRRLAATEALPSLSLSIARLLSTGSYFHILIYIFVGNIFTHFCAQKIVELLSAWSSLFIYFAVYLYNLFLLRCVYCARFKKCRSYLWFLGEFDNSVDKHANCLYIRRFFSYVFLLFSNRKYGILVVAVFIFLSRFLRPLFVQSISLTLNRRKKSKLGSCSASATHCKTTLPFLGEIYNWLENYFWLPNVSTIQFSMH